MALLGDPQWRTAASSGGTDHGDASALEYNLPAVRPGKTMCCGLNYRSHVLESRTRRELPKYPTLFAKFPEALDHVAGLTAVNDVSMRDWQRRSSEWLQGKNFEASTPVGPAVVTLDEFDNPLDLAISCDVDGQVMQQARTSELLFSIADLVSYASTFTTLRPGDLIVTGTMSGVASAREDQPFLKDGQVVTVTIEGIGSCRNEFYAEA